MKKWVCLIIGFFFFSQAFCAQEKNINSIAAVVNDAIITKADLYHEINQAKIQIKKSNMAMPPDGVLCNDILQKMIDRKLQLEEADQIGLVISPQEVDNTIKKIAAQNNFSVEQLYHVIEKSGVKVDDFKKEIHDQIVMQQVANKLVGSHINISQDEISDFVQSFAPVGNKDTVYHIEDILIPLPDAPTATQINKAKAMAVQTADALRNGMPLAKIHYEHSDLGWRKLDQLPEPFIKPVSSLQDGDVSIPVQAPNGFHLLKLLGSQNRVGLSGNAEEKKSQASDMIYQRKLQQSLLNWIAQLRAQAYIKTFPVCSTKVLG